jgi:DNA-binding NtrC family response regulator
MLLVDDEERFLATTTILLEKRGVDQIRTATNGREALRILREEHVDVVVLDLRMPGMDGMEVLRNIKHEHPMVEVIILTGHASTKSAVDGLKLGAFDYVMKPVDVADLLEKIEQACEKKRAHENKIRTAKVHQIISHPMAVFSDHDNE